MVTESALEEKLKGLLNDHPQSTWVLAEKAGMRGNTKYVRKLLNGMQKRGIVCRSAMSTKNNIIWQLPQP